MPFADTTQMLHAAQAGGYAVGAFNAENMEMAQAIVLAAQEARAPVILQTTPSTLRYADPQLYWSNVQALAQRASVPVALHLDHGNSFELCAQALRAGYTSVMIDGSTLPLVQNIALTREVVRMCAANGVPVEGELGRVGGKEDDLECSETGYTDPDEAERFEVETGVSSLAVGVGTAHGVYAVPPVLNIELIDRIRQRLRIPLVLHGASGLEEKVIRPSGDLQGEFCHRAPRRVHPCGAPDVGRKPGHNRSENLWPCRTRCGKRTSAPSHPCLRLRRAGLMRSPRAQRGAPQTTSCRKAVSSEARQRLRRDSQKHAPLPGCTLLEAAPLLHHRKTV